MRIVKEESFGVIPLKKEGKEWKVLIILHKQGEHWGFPKGRKNPDEDPKQAAIRELSEETGLTLSRFLRDAPLSENYQFYRKGKRFSKTVHYFPALVEGELRLQAEEVREAKWVNLKEAPEHLSYLEAQKVCSEVISLLNKHEHY